MAASSKPHKYKRVHRSALRAGQIVKAPAKVRDSDHGDQWVPLSTIWPDHPVELRVDFWDAAEGETYLKEIRGNSGIGYNIMDLPTHFMVRATTPTRRATQQKRRRGKAALDRKAGKKSSIGQHLARAARSPF